MEEQHEFIPQPYDDMNICLRCSEGRESHKPKFVVSDTTRQAITKQAQIFAINVKGINSIDSLFLLVDQLVEQVISLIEGQE